LLENKIIKLRGILFGLAAAFFLALSGILSKKTTLATGTEQIIVRYLMQIVAMLIAACYCKINIFGPKDRRIILIFFGIFVAIVGYIIEYVSKVY